MSWYNPLSWFSDTKASATTQLVVTNTPEGITKPSLRDLYAFIKDGYKLNPYVYAAIRLRATLFGSLHMVVKQRTRTGWQELDQHPLLDLLERPNPDEGGSVFMANHLTYKDIAGNAYIEKVGTLNRPIELWSLRPDRTYPLKGDGDAAIRGWEYCIGTGKMQFEAERVLQRRYLDPLNDFLGMSPMEAAGYSVDMSNQGRRWNLEVSKNSGKVPFIMSAPEPLEQETYNRLQTMIDKLVTSRRGRPFLAEGGLKLEKFAMTPQEADWMQAQKVAAVEACIVYGVAPELVGIGDQKTFSNFKEANRAIWINTIIPEGEAYVSDLNNWLAPGFGDVRIDFDRDQISALAEDRKMIFDMNKEAAWRTINEKRAIDGYPEIPGGDMVLVPMGMVPLSLAGGTRENSIKAIGIPEQQGEIYWKQFDAMRWRFLDAVQDTTRKVLESETRRVIKAIEDSATRVTAVEAAISEVNAGKPEWDKYLETVYIGVGDAFAARTFGQVAKGHPDLMRRKDEQQENLWRDFVRQYLSIVAAEKIDEITNTKKQALRAIFADAIEQGESIPQIAARVGDALRIDDAVRATRIARTEIIAASNSGSRAGAQATGLPLAKNWLATFGENTRETHIEAGQSQQGLTMDEPYRVGGYELMFPGDSSRGAAAAEVVNCRCTETYTVIGDVD